MCLDILYHTSCCKEPEGGKQAGRTKAVDALLNYETVVQFNNQKLEVMQYNALLQNYQNAALDVEKLSAALNTGQALIQALGIAAVMGIAGVEVARNSMTVGDPVLANGLILQLSGPLQFPLQASLRRAVAVVPQETVLFNDTLFKNIQYGRPSATREEVIKASKQARLHDAVIHMPEGYNSVVGERGLKLSGCEKQLVAIARAFLKAPRLLVCDEATSALDSTTEAAILNSLKELSAGRTWVFVAHRLSTIMHCDNILGTHQRLLETKGTYAKMWARQEC